MKSQFIEPSVTHVISDGPWDDAFDDAKGIARDVRFVRPAWIQACQEKGRRQKEKNYELSKDDVISID